MDIHELKSLERKYARMLAARYPESLPTEMFDGSPIVSAKDLAAAMGITQAEAQARWERAGYSGESKDVHTMSGESSRRRGVGTVVARADKVIERCLAKKRKKGRKLA